MSFEHKQKFDGTQPEISAAEQQHVATVFSGYVDDKILGALDQVHTSQLIPDGPIKSSVKLFAPGESEGDLGTVIYITDSPEGPDSRKSIELIKVDQIIHGQEMAGGDRIRYDLGHDGIVRRTDFDKPSDELREARRAAGLVHVGDGLNGQQLEGRLTQQLATLGQMATNLRFEEQMGLNKQPIGSSELDQVIQMTHTAQTRNVL